MPIWFDLCFSRKRPQIYAFARLTQYPMPASLCRQCLFKKSCSNDGDALGLDSGGSGPERYLARGPWKSVSCPAPLHGVSGIPARFFRVDIAALHASRSIHVVESLSHRIDFSRMPGKIDARGRVSE